MTSPQNINLNTWAAKRVIADSNTATYSNALLQTGTAITTDVWILHRTNRNSLYGIKYLYDNSTNGTADKIEFYGGQYDNNSNDIPSAWIQLDTGDCFIGGQLTIEGNIIPNTTYTYTLGSTTNIWFNTYSAWSTLIMPDIDLTDSSNGITDSTNRTVALEAMDSHGYGANSTFGSVQFSAKPNGDTYAVFSTKNYLTNNTTKYAGLYTLLAKDGSGYIQLSTNTVTNGAILKCDFNSTDNTVSINGMLYADYYCSSPSISSRPTSLNFTGKIAGAGKASMRLDLASSSITDSTAPPIGKTNGNSSGYVLSFGWDSSTAAITQLYLPNGDHVTSTGGPQPLWMRGLDNDTWSSWVAIPATSTTTGTVGGTEQPIYSDTGILKSTSYALKATVNNGDTNYVAYYSGERAISSSKAATGMIMPAHYYHNLYNNNPTTGTTVYVHYYNSSTTSTNSFANFRVKSGTSYKTLAFGGDGSFSWPGTITSTFSGNITGNVTGNCSGSSGSCTGNAATATKLSTSGTAAKFWRGDNAWSDTISGGTLKITANSNTVTIGSQNTSWCHFNNSANINFYFNHQIHAVDGFVVYNTNTKLTNNNLTFASGGGWFMSDTTWIRTVGSKSVYMNTGTFRCDGTIQAGSSGSYTWTNGGVLTALRLIATSTTDAAPGSNAAVALLTGSASGAHIEMDNNEILAKSSASALTTLYFNDSCYVNSAGKLYNAVWNDFAEYRSSEITEPGRVVVSDGKGNVILSTIRLEPGAHVISDTYGSAVGESDTAKTPLGVAGRVLVIPYQDRNNYKIGDCLCAAPNGTADIMTREEIIKYPDRIIGIVDEIPDYDSWDQVFTTKKRITNMSVEVKGRIWMYVR